MLPGQVRRRGERTAHRLWPRASAPQIASVVRSDEDRMSMPGPAPSALCNGLRRPSQWGRSGSPGRAG